MENRDSGRRENLMSTDPAKFFQSYRDHFGSLTQQQVDGLSFLIGAFNADPKWEDSRHRAYGLATIKHESAHTYEPIEERGSAAYLSKYWTKPNLRAALGNIEPADAQKFKGRGYVQITGRSNYTRFGIVEHPEKALEHQTAFEIMTRGMFEGTFTGKKLTDYINASKRDYYNARRIINGVDRAALIADYAEAFEDILKTSGG